jgi:hypothetical protein
MMSPTIRTGGMTFLERAYGEDMGSAQIVLGSFAGPINEWGLSLFR